MPKVLKSTNGSQSYSKNKNSMFLWTMALRVILFLNSSLASSKNKEYFIAVFKH